jgi:hypothetical protein
MILVIYGSRTFDDFDLLCAECDRCRDVTLVIEGGAIGADRMGREWAKLRGIPYKTMEAEWDVYGKAKAGKIRNQDMAEIVDMGMGFWDKRSTGTKDMSKRMKKLNKPHRVIEFVPNPFSEFHEKTSGATLDEFF